MGWSEVVRRALEEHKKLDHEVRILQLRLESPATDPISKWFSACGNHFIRFHTLLRQHMEMEEDGGFMAGMREHQPGLGPAIDRLKDEHRSMRRQCREIEERLESRTEPAMEDVRHIRDQAQTLLSTLKDHERQENEIAQDAFIQDIGGSD